MSLLDKLSTASKSWMVFCYQLTYLELHPVPNPPNLVLCREIVDILRTEQWHIPRETLQIILIKYLNKAHIGYQMFNVTQSIISGKVLTQLLTL